ncbi:CLUMA_CG016403, isoform A [Clunio marinus]|uniref:Acylphosphatase n=1 Tax=Clunio marinus TaxID=568069 RepID=A0A1J1IU08_9DIPT|nr:CLUMA_CG016403, isoform A [Clunio marinus]
MPKLVSCDFEVFGKVQGVYFRKYTEKQATVLGLRGWCKNKSTGSVIGKIEGDETRVHQMMDWLKTTGSPKSNIVKAIFSEPKAIQDFSTRNFTIRR